MLPQEWYHLTQVLCGQGGVYKCEYKHEYQFTDNFTQCVYKGYIESWTLSLYILLLCTLDDI